jgi:formiminotetrahydrofolate cyclodeaminase
MDYPRPTPDERTLHIYLNDLRSGKPTPGGGSAAAYCAALGASLGAMVCRLTLGRANPDVSDTLTELTTTLDDVVDRLSQAARNDELCFARYQEATRLPKATDEEKRIRREARQEALRLAAEAPLATAELAVRALKTLPTVARLGTSHALSDVESARILLVAGMESALVNVQVNVDMIANAETTASLTRQMDHLQQDARVAAADTRSELAARSE